MEILFLFIVTVAQFFPLSTCFSFNATLFQDQNISDGMTIISQNRSFELGFFSPGASRNRYVGIWYKNIPVKTVVWVANRSNPINGTSGLLMIDETGNLVLLNKNRETVWSTNVTKKALNPVMELLDSGNLVLREGNSEVYLWQSFDYPTDTLLPGMKLGIDLRTGLERNLTSWKSSDDPSPGDFVWKIHHTDNPETTFWSGSELYYRSGPWSGDSFTGLTQLHPDPIMAREFVNNQDEIYYMYNIKSLISRQVMNQSVSQRQRYNWDEASQSWKLFRYAPMDYCSIYNHCGPYGMCMINKMPICQCLRGFELKSPSLPETSDGCVRIKPLNCSRGDAFIKFDNLNLPDTTHSWVNRSMNLKQCREKCLQNCSCMAYTNFDFRGRGSGCAIWFNDLVDMRPNSQGGQALYIRMSALELDEDLNLVAQLNDKERQKQHHRSVLPAHDSDCILEILGALSKLQRDESQVKLVMMIVSSIAALLGVLAVSYYVHRRRNLKGRMRVGSRTDNNYQSSEELDLPLFDLATIAMATNNFSHSNRLGEGGFGPVYKGTLVDGQEIAVKRLSRYSGQGLREFKTEVVLIATLQHRNLVKLLGCCMKGEERMLVYEYMSNQSLDYFIFDQSRSKLLDWSNRFQIIRGIARGLLYLHEDSRLRIIHRDLKLSNILLDHNMNPKISDFGMAKTFGGDQTKGNTNRVVGTYGYMAPEYAADGLFSIKSDAFSFGVLLLEIISGRRSRGFYQDDDSLNLIGYAWRLWREGKWVELVDPWLQESWNSFEAMRCVHVGLLCVQHQADDRLDMAQVIQMLTSDMALPEPKQPGFYVENGTGEPSSSSLGKLLDACSNNDLTISIVQPR